MSYWNVIRNIFMLVTHIYRFPKHCSPLPYAHNPRLTGSGIGPTLRLEPTRIDFGQPQVDTVTFWFFHPLILILLNIQRVCIPGVDYCHSPVSTF